MMKQLILLSVLLAGVLSYAQEEPQLTKIKKQDIPKEILAVAQKAFPGREVEDVRVEARKDLKVYYIALTDPNADEIWDDIAIDETGKVLSRGSTISLDKLPPEIRAIAEKTYPDYTVDDAMFEKGEYGDVYSISMDHKTSEDNYASIAINTKGTIIGKGHSITQAEVPAAVKQSLAKKYAISELFEAFYSVEFKDKKKTECYSLTVYTPIGMRYIDFDSKGKILADLSEDEI